MPFYKLLSSVLLFFISTISYAQIVNNLSELNNAINNASPGTTIILANGTWNNTFIEINKNGTSSEPITITAQNPEAVLMTGNSRVYLKGSYLIVSGLVFQDPANLIVNGDRIEPVFELKECDNCKVINNKIDGYTGTESQKSLKFKWILNDGQYNEIAYNSFIGKYGVGSIINDNRNSTEPDYLKIHHNYFADRTPINVINEDNDQDAIRLGNSSTSLDDSFSEVHENYFYNFFGEVEVISNKSGQNKYYKNTFRDYAGTLTLRHGNNCEVYGNYFFAENNLFSGGIRVIGENHKIYNNYVEGVNSIKPDGSTSNTTGAINVSNGRLDGEINGYFQVKNTEIVHNTFVNCDYGFRIGTNVGGDLDQAPEDLIVANNIMYNSSINDYQIFTAPIGNSISEGNFGDLTNTEMLDDGDFYRLTNGSSPIDASIGTYPYAVLDILTGTRDENFDVGAEEFGADGMQIPYEAEDVGMLVGFGAEAVSNPSLAVSPSTIIFGQDAGTLSFYVVSNIDWVITENLSWLSLDVTSGSGTLIVTATLDDNTTGVERTGNIFIDEVTGGNELSDSLTVLQLNTFLPTEIPIVATTSIGMQDKDEIEEENAYDDDYSTYWTGDPDTEDEVSITFDLSCIHELTAIGINFWKADERTTSFSIAVADEAEGPFTIVIDSETSADSNANVATEQLFSLDGILTRYVKFIGLGNSSTSNWTSIANVNIYGNIKCEGTSSVFDNNLQDQGISIFPVPVKDGLLSISSTSKAFGNIEIYNLAGQQLLTIDGHGSYSKQIDVTDLKPGIYFIKMEEIGLAKFIVN